MCALFKSPKSSAVDASSLSNSFIKLYHTYIHKFKKWRLFLKKKQCSLLKINWHSYKIMGTVIVSDYRNEKKTRIYSSSFIYANKSINIVWFFSLKLKESAKFGQGQMYQISIPIKILLVSKIFLSYYLISSATYSTWFFSISTNWDRWLPWSYIKRTIDPDVWHYRGT